MTDPCPAPPRLLVLTDRTQIGDRSLVDVVAAAVDGGARGIVLREKDLPHDERAALADQIRPIVHDAGGTFIVASDPTIEADGVHLAADDPFPADPPCLVGRSCHDIDEVRAAESEPCDYVFVSPVFRTPSKPGHPVRALGVQGLQRVCVLARTKVFALGGIDILSAQEVLEVHPPHGVAVMGAIMRAGDPAEHVRLMLQANPQLAA